jgi:phosphate starvation-inducible PhoH-like protein
MISQEIALVPADNERLFNFCGHLDSNLRHIETRLKVEIANRGNAFRITGVEPSVKAACAVMQKLFASTEKEQLTEDSIHLAMQDASIDALLAEQTPAYEPPPVAIKTKSGLIKGRGLNQQQYLQKILSHDINFGVGPAGTGKTYLAVACAIEALQNEKVKKIILVRPAVEAGEKLGFLPGDMAQKVDPYLRPLYDALYDMLGFERVEKMLEKGIIEVAPLAFMRGRAQPLHSQVLTPQGWRDMGSLQVGDEVIGSNGQATQVLGVYPQGEKQVYQVTCSDGSSTLACGEHLWSVLTASDKRRGKPARLLETQQMLENLRSFHQRRYELPLLSQAVVFAEQAVPLDAYVLGLLLGDGCITGKTTPSFATADAELVTAMNQALEPLAVSLQHKGAYDYVLKNTNFRGGNALNSHPVTAALRDLNLEGTSSHTKFIPPRYLHNSQAIRVAVLQGLLDSDGSACVQAMRSCRIHYTSTSPQLRDDVIYLVRSLGGVAYCRTRTLAKLKAGMARGRAVPHRHESFVVDIRLPKDMQPFRLTRKASRYNEYGGGRAMRFIESIKPVGIMPTQCIQVASDDHLYVTDDFILTHNTLNHAFIILDEAQNTTVEQIKMFLTRIGFGSTAVVTGDVTQIDLPSEKMSGLKHALSVLKDVEGISFTFFGVRDVVRHPLVQRIVLAYEAHENKSKTDE